MDCTMYRAGNRQAVAAGAEAVAAYREGSKADTRHTLRQCMADPADNKQGRSNTLV